jgi:hypothetical protein
MVPDRLHVTFKAGSRCARVGGAGPPACHLLTFQGGGHIQTKRQTDSKVSLIASSSLNAVITIGIPTSFADKSSDFKRVFLRSAMKMAMAPFMLYIYKHHNPNKESPRVSHIIQTRRALESVISNSAKQKYAPHLAL